MFSREDFLASIQSETEICKHLFGKLPEGALEFSLGENMRNTTQLLDYLGYCGILPAICCAKDDWSEAKELVEEYGSEDASQFPARMDAQAAQTADLIAGLTDADIDGMVTLPWGEECRLGRALVSTSLLFMSTYRMQLFLHAKAAGASTLNTMNCWKGVDPT